jgi:hypothetical protein
LLALSHAAVFAPTALVVGLSRLDAPFKGGVLVPSPDILIAGLVTDATGAALVSGSWPAGLPSGFAVSFQYWITDAMGPQGFAASGAVQGTTP